MSAQLDPRTQKKISAFASRRRELIGLRGACTLIACLLLSMTALALLDRAVIMPDKLRWALSLAGYAGVAAAVWYLSLRHLLGRPSPQELARLVERAEPGLREDLISAIELGDPKNLRESHDSERFRELLQEDVGARAAKLDVPKLLPLSMLANWLKGAVAAAALVAILTLVPGLHFGKLFARALLPGVDLARPSNLKIEFLEPDPSDGIVPANEVVVVKVSITGGDVERAELEAREAGGGSEKIRLTRLRDNQFTGSLTVKRKDVDYRVRSGGAITSFHTLESRGRPTISLFSKTYREPSYTGTAEYTKAEAHGDLSAIEGTQVALSLQPDQAIAEAELRLKSDKVDVEDLVIPLEIDGDGKLGALVPITTDHSLYRVHLVAEESGFSNKFSPDYEIRAVPDLTPELQITQPTDNLEIRNDATLELKGYARDDVSLQQVKQAYRLNRDEWREVVLHTDCGKEQLIDHRWSLRGVAAKPGDLLVVKLIGVDSKGNIGESTPVRLAVTGWDQDPQKREWAEKEKAVAEELKKVAKETREMADAVARAEEVMKKEPGERSLEEQQAVVKAQNETEQANAQAEQAFEALKRALAEAPSRAEAAEMQAAAEALADFKNQNLEQLAEQLDELIAGEREKLAEAAQRPAQLAWEAANRADVLQKAVSQIAAEDNAAIAADDLGHLEERQQEIAAEARDLPKDGSDHAEAEAALLKEEQEVAAARTESAEQDLRELANLLEGGEKGLAEQAAKQLDEQGKKLEAALGAENFAEQLPAEAGQMQQRLEDVGRNAQALEQQTAQLAAQAREELFGKQPPASKAVEEAKWQAEQVAREAQGVEQQQADANANQEQLAKSEAALDAHSEQLADQLEALAEQFEDLAEIEEASPVGESQQAGDMNQVARALDDLANRAQDAQNAEQSGQVAQDLAKLQEAIEALEAGESASDLAQALAEMQQAERQPDAAAAEANADAWEVAAAQLKDLPQDLQRVDDTQPAQQQAQQAANSPESRALDNEMRQREQAAARNDDNRQAQAMAENLEKLQEQVEGVAEQLQPAVEEAREAVAQLAPTVPEMLRDLAQDVAEQQGLAESLAELAQQASPEQMGEIARQAQELLAENAQSAERLDEAMDALRHEANAEDILSEAGRERARDADDAAAQLAQAESEQVQERLEQAAAAQQPQQRSQALEAAAEQQGQLAETLNDLADKLDGIEQGDAVADQAREALRGMEPELGVEEALNDAFGKAENLAELLAAAQQDPSAALEALEQELRQNPAMQEALQGLTDDLLQSAAEEMAQAAQQESQVGEQLAKSEPTSPAGQNQQALEQAAQQQQAINQDVAAAGEAVERAARHEERLGNQPAAESLAELGEAAQQLAEQGEAAAALEAMQQPGQSPPAAAAKANAAESAIQAQAQAMSEAAKSSQPGEPSSPGEGASPGEPSPGEPSPGQPSPGEPSPGEPSPGEPSPGQPSPGQPSPGQPSPGQPQAGQPQAGSIAENLSPAEAAQAQSLAQALDALDQMMAAQQAAAGSELAQGQASPGTPPGQPGETPGLPAASPAQPGGAPMSAQQAQAAAQQALAAAAQAQAQAMAQARAQGAMSSPPGQSAQEQALAQVQGQPGQGQGQPGQPGQAAQSQQGAQLTQSAGGTMVGTTAANTGGVRVGENWSKLPPKVAKDIIEAQRQGVAPEYRSAVESYYKAIADRASKKNAP